MGESLKIEAQTHEMIVSTAKNHTRLKSFFFFGLRSARHSQGFSERMLSDAKAFAVQPYR
jgi:hypothetical protein